MVLTKHIPAILAFALAALLSVVVANFSVKLVEDRSEIGVRAQLDERGLNWAEVSADGLQVTLAGIAPTEALRFQALSAAGSIVDAARVIDDMQVEAAAALAAPRFSVELLRNDAGISVIGLIPADDDRDAMVKRFTALVGEGRVTDLLEIAAHPAAEGWDDAMAYALNTLGDLPRAKISVAANHVSITALTDSAEEKSGLEQELLRMAPPGLRLALDIIAPRPVLTPFTLRFAQDEQGVRFDACSADTEGAKERILHAGEAAGLTAPAQCIVGMGVPTPRWAQAVELAIAAVIDLGGGSVTFSDADITLVGLEGTAQGKFDSVVGELENRLPEVFALHAVLPQPEGPDQGIPEFIATRSPEGLVQLRGRLNSEASRNVTRSFAQSLFGAGRVHMAARLDENLPQGWPLRVLTALESLGQLSNGVVTVTEDSVNIHGNTGDKEANSKISQLLAAKLGEAEEFNIAVTYQEKLDPVAGLPTPDECEAEIAEIQKVTKISFEPGSATIDPEALQTMDDIAAILKTCGSIRLEIQGHTDSQGREIMNQQLSQARAQSVLNELRARRVLTSSFSAKGYGEAQPIADNKTEAGREANRRIDFRLIRPAPASVVVPESTLDSVAHDPDDNTEATEGDASE